MAEPAAAPGKGGTIDIGGRKIPTWTILVGIVAAVGLFLVTKLRGGGPSANVEDQGLNQAIGALNSQIQQLAGQVTGVEPVGGTSPVPSTPGTYVAPKVVTPGAPVVHNPSVGLMAPGSHTGGRTPGPDENWISVPEKIPTGGVLTWINPTTISVKYGDYGATVRKSGAGYTSSYDKYYGPSNTIPREFIQTIQAGIHAINPAFIGSYHHPAGGMYK